jgi:hypothetical protein
MMETAIQISLPGVLLFMGIQDFRYRAISWYAFPVLALLIFIANKNFRIVDACLIISFLVLNFGLATLIISVRNGKYVDLLKSHIGLGDLLMLICLSLYFTPLTFFLFYLTTLLIISLAAGIYIVLVKPKNFTVPLAGLQGLFFLACILASWIYGIELNDFGWLENYLL